MLTGTVSYWDRTQGRGLSRPANPGERELYVCSNDIVRRGVLKVGDNIGDDLAVGDRVEYTPKMPPNFKGRLHAVRVVRLV
jgi:cold shock CspA family protein